VKTKLRDDLTKVINGLDRALEGTPRNWVSKVNEISPENYLALSALQGEMDTALGTSEGTHNFLKWFSTHRGKREEGWGPWKKASATEGEWTAINLAFMNYLSTSTQVIERIANWEAGISAQVRSREDMTKLASILQDFDMMFSQLKDNLRKILATAEETFIETDVTEVVKIFVKFAAATMMEPLLKEGRRGPVKVDRQMALRPIGMAFTFGFVLGESHREALEKVLNISLEHPLDVTNFVNMSRMARARGDNLIEVLLGTALSKLSVLDDYSIDIALVMEEVSSACELGLKAGLVLHGVDPSIDREFRSVTERLNIHPGDKAIHRIIRELLKEYEAKLQKERPYKSNDLKADTRVIAMLEQIANLKNGLQMEQRGWCNELGLFVQMREMKNMASLQAGGKYRSNIELRKESPEGQWQVVKYLPGKWETLVSPSLELAEWVAERGGVPSPLVHDLQQAVERFHDGKGFQLPLGTRTVGAGDLRDILGESESGLKSVGVLPRLREYVLKHPRSATAWDSLRMVCAHECLFKEALEAAQQAVLCAPADGDIQMWAANLYLAALANEVRERRGLAHLTPPDIKSCTLNALGCSYSEARMAIEHHATLALESCVAAPETIRAANDTRSLLKELPVDLDEP